MKLFMSHHGRLEVLWDQILLYLEASRVVAIVGPELLRLELDGRTVLLETVLAERLARKLGVSEDGLGSNPLHQVACRYLENDGDLRYVYSALFSMLRDGTDLPIPRPLLQLAAIEPIRLFVSTTFDPFLARALDQVRSESTEVLAYAPGDRQDLPEDFARGDRPVVYHLFGKASPFPSFAVTEEDTLEFVHSLQSEARRPRNLFDELTRNNLLVLGAGLPDWLARFLIRFANRERLSEGRGGKLDVLADSALRQDPNLVSFLEHFSGRTKVFDGGAIEFVEELHRRWTARAAAAAPRPAPGPAAAPRAAQEVEHGAIFLSYASEDRAIVEALKDQLEAAKLDVWFDRDDLAGGDRFDSTIKAMIQRCSLFVPILSRHSRTPAPRPFRKEWKYALEVASQMPENRAFLFPVAIDETPVTAAEVPQAFRDVHWERLVAGRAPDSLVEALRRHFRDYQRSLGVAP